MRILLAAFLVLPWLASSCGNDKDSSVAIPDAGPGSRPGPSPGPEPAPAPDPDVEWEVLESGTDSDLHSVHVVDPDHLWVYAAPNLRRTNDGGDTWQDLGPLPQFTETLRFFNPLQGWNQHWNGVQSTSDGGQTWIDRLGKSTGGAQPRFTHASFVSPSTAFVRLTTGNWIHRTTDGGQTWTAMGPVPAYMRDVVFVDDQTGWLASAPGGVLKIHKTTNGGADWTHLADLKDYWVQTADIRPVASDHVWIWGYRENNGKVGQYHVDTKDGGATWTFRQVTPPDHFDYITDVTFVDELRGWAVANRVYYTADGGATWHLQVTPAGGPEVPEFDGSSDLRGVAFTNPSTGWIVGVGGLMLRSRPRS